MLKGGGRTKSDPSSVSEQHLANASQDATADELLTNYNSTKQRKSQVNRRSR
jgi:hypothetical protein